MQKLERCRRLYDIVSSCLPSASASASALLADAGGLYCKRARRGVIGCRIAVEDASNSVARKARHAP